MRYEYVADIVLEAKTALSVGSGEYDAQQDMPIQRDWNGLPIIMGTSIAGVLRSINGDTEEKNELFGYQLDTQDEGVASQLIISSALLMHRDQAGRDTVIEEMRGELEGLMQHYVRLPLRNHTAIDHRGTADDGTKHDKEIVYKGSRFKCRIKMRSETNEEADKERFENILRLFYDPRFRIGSKTTGGLGNLKPLGETITYKCFDVTSYDYYRLSSSLNQDWSIFGETETYAPTADDNTHIDYSFRLKPESFYIFGSGFGRDYGGDTGERVDHIAVREHVIDYEAKTLRPMLLIPASSIKGSLSHRTAFHYNRLKGIFADDPSIKPEDFAKHVGENNDAVKAIFGARSQINANGKETGHKGHIYIEDVYIEEHTAQSKVFDHIAIDDFTSAPIGQALFNEESVHTESIPISISIDPGIEEKYVAALKEAIADLKRGWLPLGGMASRGHGVFAGEKKEEVAHA